MQKQLVHQILAITSESQPQAKAVEKGGRRLLICIISAMFFAVLLCSGLQAQVASGTIVGTVTDSSGGLIPKCSVTVTSTETNLQRVAETDGSGVYSLPSLQPGSYRITVAAAGFANQVSTVEVTLDAIIRADFKLGVGGSNQTVEVQANGVQLQTESHEVSSTFSSRTIENLPSAGRDVFSTLTAAPNVQSYATSNGNSDIDFFQTGGNSLTIGGTTYGNTSYLQDGVTNYNLLTKTANLQPSPEDVQEVSIQANGASARFAQPAVVNIITKGGSNSFHGRVYDYFRNDDLNAKNYFSTTKAKLRYNNFGVNIGGPIFRNKLFFFFSYTGLRSSTGFTQQAFVPTSAERSGDFSADPFTIYDPNTYNPTTGTISPFPGNIIPTPRISSFATNYLPYFPLPNGSAIPGNNFQKNLTPQTTFDDYLGRLDYNIGSRDSIYGAIEVNNPTTNTPSFSAVSLFTGQNIQDATNGYAQETHTFSPTLVNVARFGYNHSNIFETLAGAGQQMYSKLFGLPFITPATIQELPPTVSFSSHSGLGNAFAPDGANQHLYQYTDELNKTIGKHSIFVGLDVSQIDFNASWVIWNNGQLNFNGQYTSNHSISNLQGGSDVADFLLGLSNQAYGANGYTTGDFKQVYVMPYVQDDWKLTPKLTLNLGLRYDFYESPSDHNGHSNVYDVATNTNHPGTFRQNYLNFAPRFGFAYSVDDKTVLRGGYGIYYSTFLYNELQFLLANQPNYTLQINTFAVDSPTAISNVFVANPNSSVLSPFTTALNMPTTNVQQWNLAVQRSFGNNWLASITYLGNKLSHLQERINPNQATPPDPSNITPISSRRPYAYVGDVLEAADVAYGNYNALQAQLERRFSNGLTFNTNYVWSKALDNDSTDNETPRLASNLGLDYGRADFDRTHVFKLSGVYDLPYGKQSSNLLKRELIGGWQVSGIFIAQSGTPTSVFANDLSQTGGNHLQYANQVCNGNSPSSRGFNHWFDTTCFVQPGIGVLGNAGRNDIIGPRYTNLDASAMKTISFGDVRALQLRADLLGALNHPQGSLPAYNQTVASPTYGQVTSVSGSRVIQLSLKAIF
ncbi:TonB-dependent receptor [Tunturibacter empetritectus]|uniref:TonB-dependent transporter Oar-like beta-barrel domain-containing protein n=1 Tax=Tunturiibacter lichenicola TaxID=2051959 RepID=A0A7W8N2G0_9BACT|nr:TonB-dependent receptor [Edaphobacter lichenicola]MBB5343367.1 hypothetical protein [Edaphobacter lichenicola]